MKSALKGSDLSERFHNGAVNDIDRWVIHERAL